ncbi:MAG: hypothetical protein R3F43_01890 [bacterium]
MVTIEAGRLTETTIDLDAGPGFSLDQRTVSYVVMGVGGAVLLGGVVTSILAVGADGDLADCLTTRPATTPIGSSRWPMTYAAPR